MREANDRKLGRKLKVEEGEDYEEKEQRAKKGKKKYRRGRVQTCQVLANVDGIPKMPLKRDGESPTKKIIFYSTYKICMILFFLVGDQASLSVLRDISAILYIDRGSLGCSICKSLFGIWKNLQPVALVSATVR